MRLILCATLLFVPCAIAWAQHEDLFATLYSSSGLPGFCIANADAQGTRFAAGHGFADLAARVPYSPDTVQPVGSVGKTIVGQALADLAERGELDLDAAVDDPLPYPVRHPRHQQQRLTGRQLATHTAAVIDDPAAYERAYVQGD
jgi:CubicO group peptidase (beta-lactamase class C family)